MKTTATFVGIDIAKADYVRDSVVAEVAPRDWIEHSLQEIWEEVLGTPGIGIRTSFLKAGGDTRLAELMLDRAEKVCDIRVPLAAFLEEPTIERLAAAIEPLLQGSLPASYETFSPPTAEQDTAVFLVSDASSYRLARVLGKRRRIQLLPYTAVDRPALESVEATAAACLRTVRQLQPSGPYHLAGFCLGALVAFELARRLEREGETVGSLILLAPRPWRHRWLTRRHFGPIARLRGLTAEREMEAFVHLIDLITNWDSWRRRARHWLQRPLGEKIDVGARKVQMGLRRLAGGFATRSVAAQMTRHPAVIARRERHRAEWAVYKRVNYGYVPGPYTGRITILWPEGDPCDRPGYPDGVWREVAGKVDLFLVRGGHLAFVTRHVESLADRVMECLPLVQATPKGRRDGAREHHRRR